MEEALTNLQSEIYNLQFLLPPKFKAIGERLRQACLDNFLLRRGQVVFYPPLFDDVFLDVIDAISGTPISIARLADAADVNEISFRFLDGELIDLDLRHMVVADERSCYMGVSKETDRRLLIGKTGDGIEAVEDVAPLVRRIEGGVNNSVPICSPSFR